MRNNDYLFSSGDLSATFENIRDKLRQEINELSPSQLLPADYVQVCDHFIAKNTIQPIELQEEAVELIDPVEKEIEQVDRSFGNRYIQKVLIFRFEIPFTGEAALFQCSASTFGLVIPVLHHQ